MLELLLLCTVLLLLLSLLLLVLSSRRVGAGGDAHGRPVSGHKGYGGGSGVVAAARAGARNLGPGGRTDLCIR